MQRAEAKTKNGMARGDTPLRLQVIGGHGRSRRRSKVRRVKRFVEPVTPATGSFDPLFERPRSSRWGRLSVYLLAALMIHAGVFFGLLGFGKNTGAPKAHRPEKVTVRMVPPEPKPAPPPEPVPLPKLETAPAPEPVMETAVPKPVKRIAEKRTATAPKKAVEPVVPVDPVNIAETPPAEPRRRVVGISFESTVNSGNGPSFAVGNTRMGATGKVAEDGAKIAPISGRPYQPGAKTPNGNRISTTIPTAGVTLIKPKRLASPEPVYPKLLKAQGIEGDVAMLIQIDEDGAVLRATVVKGSGYDAFDEAAKVAALKARFTPAKRNGAPIPYTLKYTYRFRVKEK